MVTKKQSEIISRYAQVLHDALREVRPEDQDLVLDNFVEVLRQERHLALIDEITKAYTAIKNPHSNATENQYILEHFNSIIAKDQGMAQKVKAADSQIFVIRQDNET